MAALLCGAGGVERPVDAAEDRTHRDLPVLTRGKAELDLASEVVDLRRQYELHLEAVLQRDEVTGPRSLIGILQRQAEGIGGLVGRAVPQANADATIVSREAIHGDAAFDGDGQLTRFQHPLRADAAIKWWLAAQLGAAGHVIIDIDLRVFGGSALTAELAVPKDRPPTELGQAGDIPITYVPARNTIFLSYALAYAEVLGAADLFLGINAVDYSGYPDCRPEYLRAFQRLADLATRAGVQGRRLRVHAPLLKLSKAQIIKRGLALGVDYGLTRSCYDPRSDGAACGRCDSCQLRLAGFAQSGQRDPAPYVAAAASAPEARP